ncbi:hypothetical protein C8046_08645 [Serinibacter arcticus]|uniref:Uncharacterized protein n=1 Tax=Serinibacter arcticus TaxID=1655435 RepID=A0A2U1ZUQ8_9MICO|nr:hypothetical protein [Serinibacter arcticus]PWD50708.1 hypothetical protein C8046_08645 [Serinibacter arcticus]
MANLPRWARVSVLAADTRGTPASSSVPGVLASVRRACRGVVLDLPRTADEGTVRCCDLLVVVSGTDAGSAAGLAALLARLGSSGVETVLAVRRDQGVAIAGAEELAQWCGLPLAGRLPSSPRLRGDLARGLGPGERRRSGLVRAVRHLAEEVGLA